MTALNTLELDYKSFHCLSLERICSIELCCTGNIKYHILIVFSTKHKMICYWKVFSCYSIIHCNFTIGCWSCFSEKFLLIHFIAKSLFWIHNNNAVQSWTALFRAFSSHRQPSAIFSKVFPAEQTSWPNWQTLMACTEADALVGNKRFFHLWYFRNKWKSRWILEVRTAIDYPYYKDSPLRDHGNQNCTILMSFMVDSWEALSTSKIQRLFHLFLKYHKWKNRLFPTKPSASVQAIKVCQLGQDVCSAGNTFEKIAEGCRWELKARNSAVQLCAYLTWATMWNIIGAAGLVVVIAT